MGTQAPQGPAKNNTGSKNIAVSPPDSARQSSLRILEL